MKHLTVGQAEFAIGLAKRAHARWLNPTPGEPTSASLDEMGAAFEERYKRMKAGNLTPDEQALMDLTRFIETLPLDARLDITALAFLGRDDFADFDEARRHADEMKADARQDADYLTSKGPLSEYLERGLAILQGEPRGGAGTTASGDDGEEP